jgi:hypothetical protein
VLDGKAVVAVLGRRINRESKRPFRGGITVREKKPPTLELIKKIPE